MGVALLHIHIWTEVAVYLIGIRKKYTTRFICYEIRQKRCFEFFKARA